MSKIAKSGFKNEDFVRDSIKNRTKLGLDILEQIGVRKFTKVVTGREIGDSNGKSDVIIFTDTKVHGISVKRINGNYNQIDKRKVDNYLKLWDIENSVLIGLKKFCGEIIPDKKTRDSRRYFMDELDENEYQSIINFFQKNKDVVLNDIFVGRGKYAAKWMLIVQYVDDEYHRHRIMPMSEIIKKYGDGTIGLTPRKSIKIGKVVLQRKGGNCGGPTARMLQFKMRPRDIF